MRSQKAIAFINNTLKDKRLAYIAFWATPKADLVFVEVKGFG
ncbi:MAG: hypothetical protein RMK50_00315 [Nitrososphaerota archaeon]|nr:hypothetical protein [Candidatus Bathyarchaeota archaeon]MDW8193259.1 hypothetical protein [Nitrososphaerota archaeon]